MLSMPEAPLPLLTKVIATAGPACNDTQMLTRLISQGVRVFRINFSHGSFEQFGHLLAAIRAASEEAEIEVAVLGDLCGPKIRIGEVAADGVLLNTGDRIRIVREEVRAEPPVPGDDAIFSLTRPSIIDDVQPGHRIYINDGAIRALVVETPGIEQEKVIVANVTAGGIVVSGKGVNLPDTDLNIEAITDHDWRCVDWALTHDLEFLALSFVRRVDELRQLKKYINQHADDPGDIIPVVAKIERREALDDLEAIVAEADAVMVARGDLGVEMDLVRVPIIQKRIVAIAHDYGKPTIVATQMLQSMIDSPTPTRAEVSDVANAIFDGTDAVMLSGETAVGRYPYESVRMIASIAREMQEHVGRDTAQWGQPPRASGETGRPAAALAHGVTTVARELGAKLIVVWSQKGGTARYLSQNRPTVPIIGVTSDYRAMRRMNMLFAVWPVLMTPPGDIEDFAAAADQLLIDHGWAEPGDAILIVAGEPLDTPGLTNTLRIHHVGGR